jgi:hypothetical protein
MSKEQRGRSLTVKLPERAWAIVKTVSAWKAITQEEYLAECVYRQAKIDLARMGKEMIEQSKSLTHPGDNSD